MTELTGSSSHLEDFTPTQPALSSIPTPLRKFLGWLSIVSSYVLGCASLAMSVAIEMSS
jgi:hypothetical protein